MASPQKENGFAPIANEILEAFARVPSIGSEAFQVLMLVLRRTYGFHQKEAEMSISFIAKGTGLSRRSVVRASERLVSKRILVHEKSRLSLNKNYDEWVVSKRTPSVQTDTGVVSKRRTKVVSKRTLNKDIIKIHKLKIHATSKDVASDIVQIFEIFQNTINPTINYGNKTQRKATQILIEKFGVEKVTNMAKFAVKIASQPFAPVITNPYQLKEKIGQLVAFKSKHDNKPLMGIRL